jgi:O-methyltransferase/methyltransferase family protein
MSNTVRQSEEPTRSPQQILMQVPQGMWVAQCVATAARLGIADALAQSQPQGSTALARAVGADASALARLLRALASLGVLAEPLPQQYALTPVGELLRADVPGSMRDWLIAETDTPHWQAWGQLYEGVRSGRTVVPELFGMHIYEYYAAHQADLAFFSRAMGNVSALVAHGTVQHYDFSRARHIIDVGGADGGLLLAILDANPHVHGTVFDRPQVVEAARQAIEAKNYQARCHAVGGDFFQAVPRGGDLYLLKFILVDWKDAEALQILQNCRAAITPDGKLLVIEMTIPDDNNPSPGQLFDLNMLVMTGGQERTQSEYGALFAKAGFRLNRVVPTGSPFQVMEAVAV